jgi:hypothetical protein
MSKHLTPEQEIELLVDKVSDMLKIKLNKIVERHTKRALKEQVVGIKNKNKNKSKLSKVKRKTKPITKRKVDRRHLDIESDYSYDSN